MVHELKGSHYPQYQMTHGTLQRFVHLTEASRLCTDDWKLGTTARDSDGTLREISAEEQQRITTPEHEWFES